MVCRNICERISSRIIVGQSHYSLGKKYCRRCERYMAHKGKFCACCGMQLRTTPVRTQVQSNDEGNRLTGDDLANGSPQRR